MNTINKLFSVYSSMWQLMFALLSIWALTFFYSQTQSLRLDPQPDPTYLFIVLLITVVVAAYVTVCLRHNRKKGAKKVNPFSLRPNEVVGDDERAQQASAMAALKVYVRNHFNLPLFALLTIASSGHVTFLGILWGIFLAGYYLNYLYAMWPYLGED